MNLSWTPEETSANGQLVVINPIHTGKVMPNFSWKHRIHPSEFSRCPITPWGAPEHRAQCRGKGPFPYITWYNLYNFTFYVWIFQFNLPVFVYQRSVLRAPGGGRGGQCHGRLWRIHWRPAGEGHGRPRAAADPTVPGSDGKRALGTGGVTRAEGATWGGGGCGLASGQQLWNFHIWTIFASWMGYVMMNGLIFMNHSWVINDINGSD